MPELTPGELLGGCRVEGVIARGGMGVVYRAVQLDLQRPVALKVITADRAGDPEFRERFARESRMAAAIDHPNVVPVYAAGEERGALYIVMRYVPGRDLHALIKDDGPLPATRAAVIVAQVAAALDVAHAAGLVHRDVKPANVLLAGAGDHAYLSDFGLMRTLDPLEPLTDSGSWIGTVDFASPEQLAGERVDARSDVYSLGCVLYASLTGLPPFPRETVPATLLAHMRDPIPRPSMKDPTNQYFDRIVARALAKEPGERFPSAGDLGRAALAAARGEPVTETERTVAIGSAAPGGMKASDVTAPTSIAPPRPERPPRAVRSAPPAAEPEPAPQRLWSAPPPPPAHPARAADPPPPTPPRAAIPGQTRARTVRNAPARTPAASPDAPRPAPPAPAADPRRRRRLPRRPRRLALLAAIALPLAGIITVALLMLDGNEREIATAQTRPLAEGEVRAVAEAFADAYETEDGSALGRLLTSDVRRVLPDGTVRGRRNVVTQYETQFRENATQSYELEDLEVTGGAAGRASGNYRVRRAAGSSIEGTIVLGVVRDKGRTRVALIAVTPRS